jgi:hypothetical protein
MAKDSGFLERRPGGRQLRMWAAKTPSRGALVGLIVDRLHGRLLAVAIDTDRNEA